MKQINKNAKSYNGNIKNNLKLIQYNKGNADLQNRMIDLIDIIDEHKPELLIVNEANLHKDTDLSLVNIKGYSLEMYNLMDISNVVRTGKIIKAKQKRHSVTLTLWENWITYWLNTFWSYIIF